MKREKKKFKENVSGFLKYEVTRLHLYLWNENEEKICMQNIMCLGLLKIYFHVSFFFSFLKRKNKILDIYATHLCKCV